MTDDLVHRIEALSSQQNSPRAFGEQLVSRLRSRVPSEGYVFAVTDPVTLVSVSPVADVPMLPWARLPELIRRRYLTPSRRLDALLGTARSGLWDPMLAEIGVVDTAAVTLGDRHGTWGSVELWRTNTAFTHSELDLLTQVASAATAGLRTAVSRTFAHDAQQLLPVGPAVVILDPDLALRSQTDSAAATLLTLLPPGEEMAPIPAAAYNVGAALIAQEQGAAVGEPWGRVHLGGSRWVTVKASRLGDDIAVSIEPSTPAERTDLLGRACALSPREQEVLALVVRGLDSRTIAEQLVVAVTTAEDHVKALLAKTGCRTRQVLTARALGAA